MMLPSRLGCPLSLKIPNMGNPGFSSLLGGSRIYPMALLGVLKPQFSCLLMAYPQEWDDWAILEAPIIP